MSIAIPLGVNESFWTLLFAINLTSFIAGPFGKRRMFIATIPFRQEETIFGFQPLLQNDQIKKQAIFVHNLPFA